VLWGALRARGGAEGELVGNQRRVPGLRLGRRADAGRPVAMHGSAPRRGTAPCPLPARGDGLADIVAWGRRGATAEGVRATAKGVSADGQAWRQRAEQARACGQQPVNPWWRWEATGRGSGGGGGGLGAPPPRGFTVRRGDCLQQIAWARDSGGGGSARAARPTPRR
jgi:hypothetical protein